MNSCYSTKTMDTGGVFLMHTMWKGSISFGLVNIPVKMFSATENKDIKFKYLHKKCHTPIKYERKCPTCDEDVGWDDIVRGFEYEPGRFVIIDDEDLKSLETETNKKSIEILDFVSLSEIDPIYFDKTYYLSPQDTGEKAYHLLRQSMDDTGKIAVAKITIRNKQSLAALRVYKNVLVMETIFFPDEVRAVDLVPSIPESIELKKKELDMAIQLIQNLTETFDPQKYNDDYREALREFLNKKIQGEEVKAAPQAPQKNVIDLMDALKASVKETKPQKKPGTKKASASKNKKKQTPAS